jgi:hypothetical protein
VSPIGFKQLSVSRDDRKNVNVDEQYKRCGPITLKQVGLYGKWERSFTRLSHMTTWGRRFGECRVSNLHVNVVTPFADGDPNPLLVRMAV